MERMLLSPNEKKSHATRRYILLLLVGLQVATVAIILGISHFSLEKDLTEQSDIILQKAVAETENHTKDFLQPAYRTAKLTASLFEQGILNSKNRADIEQYFLGVLGSNAEITGVYVAGLSGDFLFVSRNTSQDNAAYLTKVILGNKPSVADFIWRDTNGAQRYSELEKEDAYKANTRPWYIESLEKQDVIWTNPYTFFTSKKPGITVALPYRNSEGSIEGVIGLDIELTKLSEFFSQLKVYGSISAFLIFDEEKFIGAPLFDANGNQLQALNNVQDGEANESIDNFAARQLVGNNQPRLGENNLSRTFNYSDTNYIIRSNVFAVDNGPNWVIGAYAPANTFLEKLENTEARNIIIALCIVIIAMIAGTVLIQRSWRPFNKLFSLVVEDEMTGLYNRRFLESVGSNFFNKILRDKSNGISIAMVDIDNFSQVNNEFGTEIGDSAIKKFTDFISSSLNSDTLLTRYGGDTFVIVFPSNDIDTIVNLLNSIRLKLDAWPLSVDKMLVRLTFSAGVVAISEGDTSQESNFLSYIHTAAKALQIAKLNGKDRVVHLDQGQNKKKNVFNFEHKDIA